MNVPVFNYNTLVIYCVRVFGFLARPGFDPEAGNRPSNSVVNFQYQSWLKERIVFVRTPNWAKMSRAIREAKHTHAQRIHGHFQDSGDSLRMWQGIQAITNYKTIPSACDSYASLPDELNDFYTRFEAQNNVAARKTIPPPNDQVLCLSTADVKRTLCRVNPRKSAGPDNIPGRVLRECAEQLADVFTDIFNISLSSTIVHTCLRTTTIIPVPKKSTVSFLNVYSPVALTPIMMKCFERLVMRHIKTQLPPSLDSL
ncbi:hypothetical protein QTP86_002689 [Hemibagrus guttatus]|nr:hypothetical protein QTP86_002689 [Hemibagrus guttatus]